MVMTIAFSHRLFVLGDCLAQHYQICLNHFSGKEETM